MAVPATFTVVTTIISVGFGGFAAYVAMRKQDWGGHRLKHFLGVYEAEILSRYRRARRSGVSAVVYVISPGLRGTVIISVPQLVFNPGRLPIEDVSVVIKYPRRFALSDKEMSSFVDPASAEVQAYMGRRTCQVASETTQVMITTPLLRGRETTTVDDQMAVIPHARLADCRQTYPTLSDRLASMPGLRDFAELEIAIFSKQTRAQLRKIDLFIVEAPTIRREKKTSVDALQQTSETRELLYGIAELKVISEFVADVSGGNLIPEGFYLKSPFRSNPVKTNFGQVLIPGFRAVDSKLRDTYVGDPEIGESACFSYRTTLIDYKSIPTGLAGDQVLSYLGLRPVQQNRFWELVARAIRLLGKPQSNGTQ